MAKIAGLSSGTIGKVKKIEESATEEQKEQLRNGKKTISRIFSEIEAAETLASQPGRDPTDAEREAVLRRCRTDLEATCWTLERYDVDTQGLRAFLETFSVKESNACIA